MLNMFKSVVGGKSTKENPSTVAPKEQTVQDVAPAPVATNINSPEAKPAPKVLQSSLQTAQPKVETTNFALIEDIATTFLEGERVAAVKMLVEYLNTFKGNVDKKFWYLLMDAHQIMGNREAFEKTALAFSHKFETSAPPWFSNAKDEKPAAPVMTGNNILILDPIFGITQANRFKEFLKAARQEQFCRINVSQCKFDQADPVAIKALYQLFKNLRKYEVKALLMGDNNLVNFCKNYINPDPNNKGLKLEFLEMEEEFWLIYLEVLQWKGRQDDFENIALDYAMKFEVSPPGWENNGIMKIEAPQEEEESFEGFQESKITGQNVQILLDTITERFNNAEKCEIDFSKVETIDFESAGSITFHIQEIWSEERFANKRVILKYPNEMILTLFNMVGTTEFLDIIPRKR